MHEKFDRERFDISSGDRVRVDDVAFGHEEHGTLYVDIERTSLGKRFVRQITSRGNTSAKRYGVYADACYFLRERSSGRYFFLEKDARGFYLYGDRFLEAQSYLHDEAGLVAAWLIARESRTPHRDA